MKKQIKNLVEYRAGAIAYLSDTDHTENKILAAKALGKRLTSEQKSLLEARAQARIDVRIAEGLILEFSKDIEKANQVDEVL